eukprot:2830610-Heterocapsa_arctica.AAC.1
MMTMCHWHLGSSATARAVINNLHGSEAVVDAQRHRSAAGTGGPHGPPPASRRPPTLRRWRKPPSARR